MFWTRKMQVLQLLWYSGETNKDIKLNFAAQNDDLHRHIIKAFTSNTQPLLITTNISLSCKRRLWTSKQQHENFCGVRASSAKQLPTRRTICNLFSHFHGWKCIFCQTLRNDTLRAKPSNLLFVKSLEILIIF